MTRKLGGNLNNNIPALHRYKIRIVLTGRKQRILEYG